MSGYSRKTNCECLTLLMVMSYLQAAGAFNYPTSESLDWNLFNSNEQQLDTEPQEISKMINDLNAERQMSEKDRFALEVLNLLHQQYGKTSSVVPQDDHSTLEKSDNRLPDLTTRQQSSLNQLLGALGADGDIRRLIDWAQNSFNLASIGEIATQFVVSKLGSVNCGAIFKPDSEESLVPRFLLFNEHFSDVPYELPITPSTAECIANGKFDPLRKTVVLIHGYLAGYTLVDGLTNIKNRLLDINKIVSEAAVSTFEMAHESNGSYVLTEDLDSGVRQHKYNVIIVDWFNGANPMPRANYIKAAVNAQVVGQLIARFLSALIMRCGTPAANVQIIAHSLGCHVAGFTGKAMNSAGHRLGKITHLDPIGLCFGHLFSEPRLRLSPNDALETQAVHVSLNLFDNPLDGAQANFLVNGGRDQPGCGGQSELKNSTSSSLSLLFDSEAGFTPCSHVRALALYEDDLSSRPGQCQLVGYRCASYEQFLAGKCGHCDALNNQCRLMSLPPISLSFSRLNIATEKLHLDQRDSAVEGALSLDRDSYTTDSSERSSSDAERRVDALYAQKSVKLAPNQRDKLAQAVDKLKLDVGYSSTDGWTSKRLHRSFGKLRNRVVMKQSSDNDSEDVADEIPSIPTTSKSPPTTTTTSNPSHEKPTGRFQGGQPDIDLVPMPLGGQKPPPGSLLGPLFYLGTGPISPYCVNYYQVRVLISASRLQRLIMSNGLAPNKLASTRNKNQQQFGGHRQNLVQSHVQRLASASVRNILHLTVKLVDSAGHFFKGFTLKENARELQRVHGDIRIGQQVGATDDLVELTMLLNSTRSEPIKVSESIVSYYFHSIVLLDRIEINYMSNISPG